MLANGAVGAGDCPCPYVSVCEACGPQEVTHSGEIHGVPGAEACLKFLQLLLT